MPLSAADRRILAAYRQWHTAPPRWANSLPKLLGMWLVLIGLALTVLGATRDSPLAPLGWGVVGMVAGAILRDLGWLRRQFRTWPLVERIIDWQRVESWFADDSPASRDVTTPS